MLLCETAASRATAQTADWQWIGALHNEALGRYHSQRGEWADTSEVQVLQSVAQVMSPAYPALADAQVLAKASAIWAQVDALTPAQVMHALRLSDGQQQYVQAILNMPEDWAYNRQARYLSHLAASIQADEQLTATQRNFPLACVSIARHSAQYWDAYPLLDDGYDLLKKDGRDTIINGDTIRLNHKGQYVTPAGKLIKADFFGLLKGMLLGTVFWIGGELPKVDIPNSLAIGIGIAVLFPVTESAVYNWKYKRGRVRNQFGHDEQLDQWELYQN